MLLMTGTSLAAGADNPYHSVGEDIDDQANGVLAIMAFSVVPDITTSDLSIANNGASDPGFSLVQIAGGFNPDISGPLYLEGGFAYKRYDPKFLTSNGQDERRVPFKWDRIMVGGGVGWDMPITPELKFSPHCQPGAWQSKQWIIIVR